jgi:endoglucanase
MTPGGSIAGAFSIPTRHIHQVIEMVHKKDVESCIELLKCCLLSMSNNNWEHKNEI